MTAPIWNGAQWVQDLQKKIVNDLERERLLRSQERRQRAFAGNFNDLHIRSNKGKRLL